MATATNPTDNLILIAGPCQIESREHCLFIAEALSNLIEDLPVDFIFKASYDKANRTSHLSPRGVGFAAGMEILSELSRHFRTTTDVHDYGEVVLMAPHVHVLQIPALLCRQTDIIIGAGDYAREAINIKKGPFMAPDQMRYAVLKARDTKPERQVWITERGTSFGYGDLVVDYRGLQIMRSSGANKILFDASHSCQRPPTKRSFSGGNAEFIEPLARAALAVGVDGLFVEVHDNPDGALSDGDIAIALDDFRPMLERLLEVWEVGKRYRHSSQAQFEAAPEQVHA
jgi:2-dehydro-3-deoxyphosphooctonate aldolase (KDO 8-P synthase)